MLFLEVRRQVAHAWLRLVERFRAVEREANVVANVDVRIQIVEQLRATHKPKAVYHHDLFLVDLVEKLVGERHRLRGLVYVRIQSTERILKLPQDGCFGRL